MPCTGPLFLLAYVDGDEDGALKCPESTHSDSHAAWEQGHLILLPTSSFSSSVAEGKNDSKTFVLMNKSNLQDLGTLHEYIAYWKLVGSCIILTKAYGLFSPTYISKPSVRRTISFLPFR